MWSDKVYKACPHTLLFGFLIPIENIVSVLERRKRGGDVIRRTEGPPGKNADHVYVLTFQACMDPEEGIFIFAYPWNVFWFPWLLFFFFFCISRGYRPGLRHPSPLRSISSCVFYPFFSGREIIWTVKRRAGRCCCYHQNHCCEFLEEQVTQATRAREKQQTPQLPCDQKFYYVLLSITLVVYFDMKIVLIGRKAGPRANFLILLPSRI